MSGGRSRPKAVDYFVIPPELQEVVGTPEATGGEKGRPYGPKPTALDVLLPFDDLDRNFDVHYKLYGANGKLKCRGDGERARRLMIEDGRPTYVDGKCPCRRAEPTPQEGDRPDKPPECKPIATLTVRCYKKDMATGYQFVTSSWNSAANLQATIETLIEQYGPAVVMIPLIFRVRMQTVRPIVNGKQMATKQPIVSLEGHSLAHVVRSLKVFGDLVGLPEREAVKMLEAHKEPPDVDDYHEGVALVCPTRPLVFPDDYPEVVAAADEAGVNASQLTVMWTRAGHDPGAVLEQLQRTVDTRAETGDDEDEQGRLL